MLCAAGFPSSGTALAAASPADRAVTAAVVQTEARPGAGAGWVTLAGAFVGKARESGDPAYYRRAEAALDQAVALRPDDYAALRMRALVLGGLHEFGPALAVAERARAAAPDDAWNDATIFDAAVELGDYPRAEAAAERLAARRPGLAVYARVGLLRGLHGDHAGALAVLTLAVRAGTPDDPESLAWALVHLGHESFAGGDTDGAAAAYARARAVLPGYAPAAAGLARVRAAEGRLASAIALYEEALAAQPAPDLAGALGDLHAERGDAGAAGDAWALVDRLARLADAAGVSHGRPLVLFWADHGRPADALRVAEREARVRDDVHTADALAWALYRAGRLRPAARAAHRALRLGTRDAVLDYHAGVIAAALGRPRAAARHLRRALATNPRFDRRFAADARARLGAPADGGPPAGERS
jgi:tetratricopeptide (TPR) repeat protein